MAARKPLSSVVLIALFAAVLLFGYTTLWSSTAAFSDVTDNAGNSLAAAASFSGISQEQKATAMTTGKEGFLTASFPAAPTLDNLLIAVYRHTTGGVLTPPAGWSLAVQDPDQGQLLIYYKVAGAAESPDVTFSVDTDSWQSLTIFEYSGMATASPLDRTASNMSGAKVASISTGTTATTTQADELVIAAVSTEKTPEVFNNTWTNGFGQESALVVDEASQSTASRIVSATGQFETTESWSKTVIAVGAIATFKAAP